MGAWTPSAGPMKLSQAHRKRQNKKRDKERGRERERESEEKSAWNTVPFWTVGGKINVIVPVKGLKSRSFFTGVAEWCSLFSSPFSHSNEMLKRNCIRQHYQQCSNTRCQASLSVYIVSLWLNNEGCRFPRRRNWITPNISSLMTRLLSVSTAEIGDLTYGYSVKYRVWFPFWRNLMQRSPSQPFITRTDTHGIVIKVRDTQTHQCLYVPIIRLTVCALYIAAD